MSKYHPILFVVSLVLLSASCKEKQSTTQNTTTTTPTEGIASVQEVKSETPKASNTEVPEKIWMSLEEALEAQTLNPKPIVIDVYTKWCGPCKMLDQNTFNDPRVKKFLYENYYPVKFDAESADTVQFAGNVFSNPDYIPNQPGRNGVHQFARYLNVNAYPTLFFMDKAAQPVGPLSGYRTPAQIEIYLKYFAEEKYNTIRTQEEFQEHEKNFVVTWN
jgi:thioredoxin-related protein